LKEKVVSTVVHQMAVNKQTAFAENIFS
jgi:hypothetical protein